VRRRLEARALALCEGGGLVEETCGWLADVRGRQTRQAVKAEAAAWGIESGQVVRNG